MSPAKPCCSAWAPSPRPDPRSDIAPSVLWHNRALQHSDDFGLVSKLHCHGQDVDPRQIGRVEYIFEANAVLFRRYDCQSKAIRFSEQSTYRGGVIRVVVGKPGRLAKIRTALAKGLEEFFRAADARERQDGPAR